MDASIVTPAVGRYVLSFYLLALRDIGIDLNDDVKVNYRKFDAAHERSAGLEAESG